MLMSWDVRANVSSYERYSNRFAIKQDRLGDIAFCKEMSYMYNFGARQLEKHL